MGSINRVEFVDPATGQRKRFILGECGGAITFGQFGNVVSLCVGTGKRGQNLNEALNDISPGDFYLDNKFRPVVALPDGRVQVFQPVHSPLSRVDASVVS